MQLHFRQKSLDLTTPKIMGILNATPDSFSDGGQFNTPAAALLHVRHMLACGAHIIDIGGESTRPNAPSVSTDEELERVIPIIQAVRDEFGESVWLSVDTSSPKVMQQAIEAGADMINDVRGLRRDGACQMVAKLGCPVVIMHSRGDPDTMTTQMNTLACYDDVVHEVIDELENDVQRALSVGVRRENIVIDVGMGFAKQYEHHIALMQHLDQILHHFELPMLFGVSRKRFLGEIVSQIDPNEHLPTERDAIGAVAHLLAIQKGAAVVRVHDVAKMAQSLMLWQSTK